VHCHWSQPRQTASSWTSNGRFISLISSQLTSLQAQRAYIAITFWGRVVEKFFSYNWMKLGISVRGHGAHSHQKLGLITPGVPPHGARPFIHQWNAAFKPLILHRFRPFLEKIRESVSATQHAYISENF